MITLLPECGDTEASLQTPPRILRQVVLNALRRRCSEPGSTSACFNPRPCLQGTDCSERLRGTFQRNLGVLSAQVSCLVVNKPVTGHPAWSQSSVYDPNPPRQRGSPGERTNRSILSGDQRTLHSLWGTPTSPYPISIIPERNSSACHPEAEHLPPVCMSLHPCHQHTRCCVWLLKRD